MCSEIHSLSEYLKQIGEYASGNDPQNPKVLWFRGLDYSEHPMIPSLFRDSKLVGGNKDLSKYSTVKYAEDIRTQHYIAKNYHSFAKLPASRIEWLEVMQHHEVKTRVLDWSESAIHSLLFAVEPFLSRKFNAQQRKRQFPCVWVLEPAELNKNILKYFSELDPNNNIIPAMIGNLKLEQKQTDAIINNIKNFYRFIENEHAFSTINHLKYIFNLSTINDEIRQISINIGYALEHNEYPAMFYLLKRIYGDGTMLINRDLPPLAVNHPYHSERIKSQKGVFTVFPNYAEQDDDENLRGAGFEPNAMQYNSIASRCMRKIKIMDPEQVAYDLLSAGMNTSWLYPELPVVANEIEFHRIY